MKDGIIKGYNATDELVCRYEYDGLNRLVREDNKAFGKTVLFAYDANGNITSKRSYAYTTTKSTAELEDAAYTKKDVYSYNGDQLMAYNSYTFAYDAMGNPTSYKGKTLSWSKGRLLTAYGDKSFAYDGFGRCVFMNGNAMMYGRDGTRIMQLGDGLVFVYDHTGLTKMYDLSGMGDFTTVYVQKDALGNVRALLDSYGNIVVKYKYDAWGNCKVLDANGNEISEDTNMFGIKHIGHRNPFRYRGYYYDVNTGLYYLQSRFYDPETGRFINADTVEYLDPESINGLNLYAYCGNNPVMYSDPTGNSLTAILITLGLFAVAGGIIGGVLGAETANAQGLTGVHYVAEIVHGAFKGFISGLTIGGAVLLFATGIAASLGYATLLGAKLVQAWAISSLALNSISIFGVLFGVETEPVEYVPTHPYLPTPSQPFKHPGMK